MDGAAKQRLGFFYDPVMQEHRPPSGHPERPARIQAVMDHLERGDLSARLERLSFQPAGREQLERVHSRRYLDTVERIVGQGGAYLDGGDTVASSGSWAAATMAAGAGVAAVDAVMSSRTDGAFALVRPPGHHAMPDAAMGFCIVNNAAVAAAHAAALYDLEKILLVDFDVHHGNGTQKIFYADPRVLYFSTHQSPAYPGTGRADETGRDAGTGTTVNVPLPASVGDDGFAACFERVLLPAADRFQPQIVLVSAGYDAHWRNSAYVSGIAERMTVRGFAEISRQLKQIADTHCPGRLVGILEGGYDLESLAYGVAATLSVWMGAEVAEDPIGTPPMGMVEPEIGPLLERIRRIHHLDGG
jgi:acetoin utilization deacetylase AcuC-like enzyme